MEWLLGGCLVLLILIWVSVNSAIDILKELRTSLDRNRSESAKLYSDLVHELVAVSADLKNLDENVERMSDRYAPRESDVDRFERKMLTEIIPGRSGE